MGPGKFLSLCCVFIGGLSAAAAWYQPGTLQEKDGAKLQPGLTLFFLDGNNFSKAVPLDVRPVRLAALHVPVGSPHSTLLPAGRFVARLTGLLKLDLNDEAKFKIVGSGDADLHINGKSVLTMKDGIAKESAAIELMQGENTVEIRYSSPALGDSTLRVYWSGDEFGWEPLPPDRLFCAAAMPS